MKNIFYLFIILGITNSYAQRNFDANTIPANQPIEIKNGKFYVANEEFSNYDIKKHLEANSFEAYNYYKKYKTKSSVGGLLLGLGCGLVVGDVVKGLVSDEDYPGGMTYVGAGLAAVSIPVLSGRKKQLQKSIDTYNNSLSTEKTLGSTLEIEVASNQNGIGLNIRF